MSNTPQLRAVPIGEQGAPPPKPNPTPAPQKQPGAREGAGRKPRALRFQSELATAESKIMAALPDAIDALILAAKSGDRRAAIYLLDRAFGRIAAQAVPLADDRTLPMASMTSRQTRKRTRYSAPSNS